jgi:oligoribonuclease NrnB/cAMP/cGMP phosphodiesterase (DHH superfamily)
MKVFFHSSDADGWCSGAIIKQKFPECETIGINYGDEFPWHKINKNELTCMVDFSLQPFSDMIKLNKKSNLIWIDHHKSAIKEAEKNHFVASFGQKLEIGRGACELVWEYFHSDPVPKAVRLLSLYDVWKLEEGTEELQNGLRLYDTHPDNTELWRELFLPHSAVLQDCLEKGKFLLQKQRNDNESYAKACAFETELDGLKVIAINRGQTNSKIFESVYDPERHDAMAAFVFRGNFWTVSLYTDKDNIDVSEVCKARGGGGHQQAAGFQTYEFPFQLGG